MAKKFSELTSLTTLVNEDIFAVTDTSESISKKVTANDLRNYLVGVGTDGNIFVGTGQQIVSEINNYDGAGSGLDADKLDGQEGAYYLDYNNFTNAPPRADDLSDLANTTGFVKVQGDIVVNYNTETQSFYSISTNFIPEGNNLYYTEKRFSDHLDEYFPIKFAELTATFDSGRVTDSLWDVKANFQDIINNQTSKLYIQSSVDITKFVAGQNIRIYGANPDSGENGGLLEEQTSINANVTKAGFNDFLAEPARTFEYKLAKFNSITGNVAPASIAYSVTVNMPDDGNGEPDYTVFGSENNIQIAFDTPGDIDEGYLLYRREPNAVNYVLIAVLGPRDAQNPPFIDYYTNDYVAWGGKNLRDNSYVTDQGESLVIHFPHIAPAIATYGWMDTKITNVDTENQILTLQDTCWVRDGGDVWVAHNDSGIINSAITVRKNSGNNSIQLNAKTYVVDSIRMENEFGIRGVAGVTKIVKLPWSTIGKTNNIIRGPYTSGASNMTLVDFNIDGNSINQFLVADSGAGEANYAINLGSNLTDCTISNVNVKNVIGGGLYAPISENMTINISEFINSGLSDRYAYAPLIAYESTNLTVTNNRFNNFTDYVDTSVSTKGIVTNNSIINCGAGLFVYGSKFLLSSPNILIGPAGELLPPADILNTEFDSVNLVLAPQNEETRSAEIRYTVNGNNFDFLHYNGIVDGNGNPVVAGDGAGNMSYELWKLRKTSFGEEILYEEIPQTTITLEDNTDVTTDEKAEGVYAFVISSADTTTLRTTYNADALRQVQADHEGLVYFAKHTEFVASGDILNVPEPYRSDADGVADVAGNHYTFRVENYSNIQTGRKVYLYSHVGMDSIDADGNLNTGEIVRINIINNSLVEITVDMGTITDIPNFSVPGNGGGILVVRNKFTVAQGRVIF